MLTELKNKIQELKEIRKRVREHINDESYSEDLRNVFKGQSIELINQIQYLQHLVTKIEEFLK